MKINMKNLILVSLVLIIIIITGIVCIKVFQNKETTIITDSIATSEASIISTSTSETIESITSNITNVEGEFADEDNVIMTVTNTGGKFITKPANIISSNKNTNNLVYGDGWVATKGYDPNEGKATNTPSDEIKQLKPVEIPTINIERDMSKVTIEIVEGTLTNKNTKLLITDNNVNPGGCGVQFFVQEKVDDEWIDLELLPGRDAWIEIALVPNENHQIIDKINIENRYGTLKPGIYRIGKQDYPGVYTEEFEIK